MSRFTLLVSLALAATADAVGLHAAWGRANGVLHHAFHPPSVLRTSLEELTNTQIPGSDGHQILAYTARPTNAPTGPLPVLVLLHEFFGLTEAITAKAAALADELGCVVVAPDTFRGETARLPNIPKAIWLALSTPTERVNADLDDVLRFFDARDDADASNVAVMGFCYGGGKALRYTTQARADAATVVFYGNPVSDTAELGRLRAPLLGVFGANDPQIPAPVVDKFREALASAGVEHDVVSYENVGHAFWSDMGQIEREESPQIDAYRRTTAFLREYFAR